MSRILETVSKTLAPRLAPLVAVILALVGAVVVAGPSAAHVADPTSERGFAPSQVYQFNDLDSVNLFNGNLTIGLPIGPVYEVGGDLSYQLQLVYNSKIWDFEYDFVCGVDSVGIHINGDVWSSLALLEYVLYSSPDGNGDPDCFTIAIPNRKSNAGTGWTVGFGQLYPPRESGQSSNGLFGDTAVNDFPGWLYVSPDGSEHEFYETLHGEDSTSATTWYTRDGTFLRLEETSSSHVQLHLSNGVVHTFEEHTHAQAWEDHWRLTSMSDSFGNRMWINYPSDLKWEIYDDASSLRKHTVEFVEHEFRLDPEINGTKRKERILKSVTLAGPGGATSSYEFLYGFQALPPNEISYPPTLRRGCPNSWDGSGTIDYQRLTEVMQLTKVVQPDGTSFEFDYTPDETAGTDAICSHTGGRLQRLTLPTRGGIDYEYGPFVSTRDRCYESDRVLRGGGAPRLVTVVNGRGVNVRREAAVSSALDDPTVGARTDYIRYFGGDWDFTMPSDGTMCDLPKTGVTAVFEPAVASYPGQDPSQQKVTLHYFSIFQGGAERNHDTGEDDPGFDALGWQESDYALPFTRESVEFGPRLPEVARDPADPDRFVSRETYHCPTQSPELIDPSDPNYSPYAGFDISSCTLKRRTFVEYEHDPASTGLHCGSNTNFGPCSNLDRRLSENLTYFLDDTNCDVAGTPGEPCWRGVLRRDYDGLGNYRTKESVSGYDETRTVWTNYNPGVNFPQNFTSTDDLASFQVPGSWILGTFSDRNTRKGNGLIFFEAFDFDSTTGFLKSHTRHRSYPGTSLGSMKTTYVSEYESDKPTGNVEWERYSGGDDGNAAGTLDYVVHHEYEHGVRARSEYRDPQSTGKTVLRFLDRDIDEWTGLVTRTRDSAGFVTDLTYDSMWRLASATPGDSADALTSYEYHPAVDSQPARVRVVTQRQNGQTGGMATPDCTINGAVPDDAITLKEYEYDGLGRVRAARTWMPGGLIAEVATEYSPQGQVVRKTTPYDACVGDDGTQPAAETSYDVFGRPEVVLAPDNEGGAGRVHRTRYSYQGARREDREVEGLGADGSSSATTTLTYSPRGDLKSVTDALGTRWRYYHDQGGRIFRVDAEPPGGTTETRRRFEYDSSGILLSETHPELAGVTLQHGAHDARGNPGTLRYGTQSSSFDLGYTYDAAERRVRVRELGTGRLLTERFYGRHGDGSRAGKLVASKRHNYRRGEDIVVSRWNYYQGPSGRLSRQRLSTGGEREVPRTFFEVLYGHDSLGNIDNVDYPDCFLGWCTGETVSPDRQAVLTRQAGLLHEVEVVDAASGYQVRGVATLSYDHDGLVTAVQHSNGAVDGVVPDPAGMGRPESMSASGPGGSLWSSGTYSYDAIGNIQSIGSDSFDYDLVHRLRSASMTFNGTSHSQSYTYDYFGNMLSKGGAALYVTPETNRRTYWSYDTAGNVAQTEGDYSYQWDALGAMMRATQTSGSPDREYLYDADGERVAVLHLSAGEAVREVWSLRDRQDRVLRDVEYLPKSGTSGGWRWLKDYVYREDRVVASFDSSLGERHYHLDHLGTTRAISDAAGNLVSRHKYLPFGEEIDPPADIGTERLRFTGHERDDLGPVGQVSDLDYMHARYYRQSAARFLSIDPVSGDAGNPQSWNRYSYADGNPMAISDPDGRADAQEVPIIRGTDHFGPGYPVRGDESIHLGEYAELKLLPQFSIGLKIPGLLDVSFDFNLGETIFESELHKMSRSSVGFTAQLLNIGPSLSLVNTAYADRVRKEGTQSFDLQFTPTAGPFSPGDGPRTLEVNFPLARLTLEDPSPGADEVLDELEENDPELYDRLLDLSDLKGDLSLR